MSHGGGRCGKGVGKLIEEVNTGRMELWDVQLQAKAEMAPRYIALRPHVPPPFDRRGTVPPTAKPNKADQSILR